MIITLLLIAALSYILFYRFILTVIRDFRSLPLPPGPLGWPLIGGLTSLPSKGCKEWEHWRNFGNTYGAISSLTTMGNTIIILNESEVADELLNKRASVTPGRPHSVIISELTSWDRLVIVRGRYDDQAKLHRKYILQYLGSAKALTRFNRRLEMESYQFLVKILKKPHHLSDHIRQQAGSFILGVIYGYQVDPFGKDSLVELAEKSIADFLDASRVGAWMIEFFPALKHLPPWFPAGQVQQEAKNWKKRLELLADKPYAFVTHCREQANYEPSYVSQHLDNLGHTPSAEEEFTLKWTAAAMYMAGADTTVGAIRTFFLAMAVYPCEQRKAQEEIDRVIGTHRLPTTEDRENLPFINALILEVLRWHPVGPLGAPHTSVETTECRGYRIPKGATIFYNVWALTHNPETYHDPMSFKPDRFLNDGGSTPERDPRDFVFGFGRRICPGRAFAQASMFLTIAKSLSAFQISKPLKDGKEVDIVVDFKPEAVSSPVEYEVRIQSRDTEKENLVLNIEKDYPWLQGDAVKLEKVWRETGKTAARKTSGNI